MRNRLLLYYGLLVPGFFVYAFGPPVLRMLFEMYFLLATVTLPYRSDFLRDSLVKLPAFLALMLVSFALLLTMTDFVIFLSGFNAYLAVLMLVPLYLAFRLLTLPWVFLRKGIAAPLAAFKSPNEYNWTVLAVLSALVVAYEFSPLLVLTLLAPASLFLHERLVESGNL
jgi:hypothetical protein